MTTLKDIAKSLVVLIGALLLVSCIADPWPEPDSMEHDEQGADDNDQEPSGGETKSNSSDTSGQSNGDGTDFGEVDTDSDMNIDGDADVDTDVDTETGTDTSPGTEGKDGDSEINWDDADAGIPDDSTDAGSPNAPKWDQVFVSTPDDRGFATIVGLGGTVDPSGTVTLRGGDYFFEIPVAADGGFATRITASRGDDLILSVETDDNKDTYRTKLVVGTSTDAAFADALVIDGYKIRRITENLVSIQAQGDNLDAGYFVIAGNVNGGTGAISEVFCTFETCAFNLITTANAGDTLDIFLVKDGNNYLSESDSRTGTTVDTIIIEE